LLPGSLASATRYEGFLSAHRLLRRVQYVIELSKRISRLYNLFACWYLVQDHPAAVPCSRRMIAASRYADIKGCHQYLEVHQWHAYLACDRCSSARTKARVNYFARKWCGIPVIALVEAMAACHRIALEPASGRTPTSRAPGSATRARRTVMVSTLLLGRHRASCPRQRRYWGHALTRAPVVNASR